GACGLARRPQCSLSARRTDNRRAPRRRRRVRGGSRGPPPTALSALRGTMTRPREDRRTAPPFGQYLSAFEAQLLHACPDHSKIVGGARSDALAAQLLHACADHRKIVSGAGVRHVPSVFL